MNVKGLCWGYMSKEYYNFYIPSEPWKCVWIDDTWVPLIIKRFTSYKNHEIWGVGGVGGLCKELWEAFFVWGLITAPNGEA